GTVISKPTATHGYRLSVTAADSNTYGVKYGSGLEFSNPPVDVEIGDTVEFSIDSGSYCTVSRKVIVSKGRVTQLQVGTKAGTVNVTDVGQCTIVSNGADVHYLFFPPQSSLPIINNDTVEIEVTSDRGCD